MAYTPDLDWVNDAPPGFTAERMNKIQLGLADASATASAAAPLAQQAAVQSAATEERLGQYGQGPVNLYVGEGAGVTGDPKKTAADSSWSGGYENTFLGAQAGMLNRRGWKNTAIGMAAMRDNVDGYYNVAIGNSALERNVGGIGDGPKEDDDPGARNVAIGSNALRYQTTARGCIGIGRNAAHGNLTGSYITAIGTNAYSGTVPSPEAATKSADNVTAIGYGAAFNTDAPQSTAVGVRALYQSVAAASYGGTAVGHYALYNSEARENTALGNEAGRYVTTGRFAIAIGARALGGISAAVTGNSNTAIGTASVPTVTTGQYNIGIGQETLNGLTTGSFNVAVGHQATTAATEALLGATALGAGASAVHDGSVALGRDAATSAAAQVAIGPRHIEIKSQAVEPAAAVDGARLYVMKVGSTYSLRVRLPGGAVTTLATGS